MPPPRGEIYTNIISLVSVRQYCPYGHKYYSPGRTKERKMPYVDV